MRTRVTVVIVANSGGEWLAQTLQGLQAQTVAPTQLVGVLNGAPERVAAQFTDAGVSQVVRVQSRVSFGQAITRAMQAQAGQVTSADQSADEWLWLLTEDSCPEPEALERILQAVHRSPSVVVAGPKLVDWEHPEQIIELGQSLTRYGSRWLLRRQELDQQQYDHMQDVMGVGPVGMLVRRDVWEALGGFDPALKVYDDGLDFCVRARRAGFRVEVAPQSRVRFARLGVGGPRIDRSRGVLRAAHRQGRVAQLHRRLTYLPWFVALLMWLSLPVWGVLRLLWALIREQPGFMLGELAAALRVFFSPGTVFESRRRMRASSKLGWETVRQLRVDPKSVRTARMIDRETILQQLGRHRPELHFISSGGLGVAVFALVVGVACTWWALPQQSLTGGALAPLDSLGELWRNTRPQDGIPADPFVWVLALLGTLTFWQPSLAIIVLLVLAIPIAAVGGWVWAAHLTDSKAGRSLVGLGFALSPAVFESISAGRVASLVFAAVLPWLAITAMRASRSWSQAGAASLLAGVALAASPSLLPAAVLLWLVGLATARLGFVRVLSTAIVPVVLFAPKLVVCLIAGRPLAVFADPGVPLSYKPGLLWHLLLGFPEYGLGGYPAILHAIGITEPSESLFVGLLLLPVAVLAVVGLFTAGVLRQVALAVFGGVGMLSAVAASHVSLTHAGDAAVPLWAGNGVLVYWLALLTFAALGTPALRKAAGWVSALAVVGKVALVVPLGVALVLGQSQLSAGDKQMPALVQAAGETNPGLRTLVLTPLAKGEVRAQLVEGAGVRLDDVRTFALSAPAGPADDAVAKLAGALASSGEDGLKSLLADNRVGFVLLTSGKSSAERAALQLVLDQHEVLVGVGETAQGLLWRSVDAPTAHQPAGNEWQRLRGTSITGMTVWSVQIIVFLLMLLLALPTGEVTYRPEKRRKPSKAAAVLAVTPSAESAKPTEGEVAQQRPDKSGATKHKPKRAKKQKTSRERGRASDQQEAQQQTTSAGQEPASQPAQPDETSAGGEN